MRPLLSFDVETAGSEDEYALQPWRVRQRKAWLTTCAWTVRDEDGLLDTKGHIFHPEGTDPNYEKTRAWLRAFLIKARDAGYRIVGWNMTFDLAWIIAYDLWDIVWEMYWLDAMRLWRHLDIQPTFKGVKSYALIEAHKCFEPNYVDYKGMGKDLYFNPARRKELLSYNKMDTEGTLLHAERFIPQLTAEQLRAAMIEASCLHHVARANITGMHVDPVARDKLDRTLALAGHEVAAKLAEHGATEVIVRSPAKTGTLLYKKWGLPVLKNTINSKGEDTGRPSTDKEVLHELALEDERVQWLGQWRQALNLRGKFMIGLKRSTEYNEEGDKTYPQAIVFGTYTSRMTYNGKQGKGEKNSKPVGFPLHQMKRDPRFRNCIVAPEGYVIVEFDAAGQEFRWMGIKSGDETMLSLCLPGGDAHTYMAAAIHNEEYEWLKAEKKAKAPHVKKKRELGKVANLSLQYRTSKKKLRITARVQNNLPMTADEASHIHQTYHREYPGVRLYWASQIKLGQTVGYAETLAGRRVEVTGDWNGDHKWAMQSTMINYPIQGTGGEQKYLAISCMKNIINEYDAIFAWDLHDGLYFYVPIAKAMAFAAAGVKLLDNLPYRKAWNFVSPIPLPWDCKIGPAWGSLEEQEF